ncbi:hypothetical protein AB6A40_002047 [Gnathostoma spinigerum]|uniref:Suppressor of cytokine signaling 5 n=1 Tax=Gnathostoma spinigerum TaxID=75299 RepID=A0ABD6E5M5_9BILA
MRLLQVIAMGSTVHPMTLSKRFSRSLCRCLIMNVSDDDDDGNEQNDEGRGVVLAHQISHDGHQRMSSDRSCQSRVRSAAREFRSRFTFSTEPGPSGVRRANGDRSETGDEVYVVHASVDYTNCLVPALDKIIASPYYWGEMDRYEAEALLENKPEGTFLLRDSAQFDYLFSVSFRRYKRTLHARIEQKNHKFSFDFSDSTIFSADTITDLIAYYKDPACCLFFEPQLSTPLPRNFVFTLQQLCRARIASITTFDAVEKLNLPPKLKQFIQTYFYMHPVKTVNHMSPQNS